jgi:copper chaperone CopZ
MQAPTTVLRVDGMMCSHCTSSVDAALRTVPGVHEVSVDLESKLVRVQGTAPPQALMQAVAAGGNHTAELVPETVLRVEGMMCGCVRSAGCHLCRRQSLHILR